jgi:soluble lytic murein transglycosylase-like protein
LVARSGAAFKGAKPGTMLLAYAPVRAAPGCANGAASKSGVRYRIGLIAPTWQRYGHLIAAAAQRHAVPAEIILATIVDESGGKPGAIATNPGYVSDAATPSKISVGLGQMLISSARAIAPERRWDRASLSDPALAIDLVARYHARFYRQTGFDPRLVAWTYLTGTAPSLRAGQSWYPRNHEHAARYTAVFEASVAHLAQQPNRPAVSFAALMVQ